MLDGMMAAGENRKAKPFRSKAGLRAEVADNR
jgi:hypothetical protein